VTIHADEDLEETPDETPDETVDETPDETLVSRIVEQDLAAFEILHARYEGLLRSHLIRMVRDPHAAEDLLQEAFLRVWTRAEQFHARGSFRAWLLRVGTNAALNFLRSQRRRRESPIEMPIDGDDPDNDETFVPAWMIDTSSLGPDEARERLDLQQRVRDLVVRLPEGMREAIRLIYEADMDVRGAAAALAIPEGTVKSRLHHATKTLASMWGRTNGM
jgi:RNA polymerase sigma-70 factor, ECF subfamily